MSFDAVYAPIIDTGSNYIVELLGNTAVPAESRAIPYLFHVAHLDQGDELVLHAMYEQGGQRDLLVVAEITLGPNLQQVGGRGGVGGQTCQTETGGRAG